MGWELRKKPLLGQPKPPKLPKLPKLFKPRGLPKVLRPPKPSPPPPGYEYVWKDE